MMRASIAVLACTTACIPHDVFIGELPDSTRMRATPDRDLDVLLVIDNSPSMADKQQSLAESFPLVIDKLTQLDGGLPNLHVGVITSDMGTQGSTSAIPGPQVGTLGLGGCTGRGDDGALQHAGAPELTDGFLSDVEHPEVGGRVRNYSGELRDAVSRLVRVGATGCGFEQHLAAMRRALTNPVNAGFFRPDANLAVVILADEDDCSLLDPALLGNAAELGPLESFRCFEHGVVCDPDAPRTAGDKRACRPRASSKLVESIEPFIDALRAAKADPRKVMVAAIVGDPAPVNVQLTAVPPSTLAVPALSPSCRFDAPGGSETAEPAVRLAAFVDGFAGRTQLTSICNHDLSSSLDAIGATAKQLIGDPCIDTSALIDSEPDPGVQPACEVTTVRDAEPDRPTALTRCAGADDHDCYTLVSDAAACPAGDDHLRVKLQRPSSLAADAWIHVRCQRAL